VLDLKNSGHPPDQLDELNCEDLPLRALTSWAEFNDIMPSIAADDAVVISIETPRSGMELLESFSRSAAAARAASACHRVGARLRAPCRTFLRSSISCAACSPFAESQIPHAM
jgi:hypothetical protein